MQVGDLGTIQSEGELARAHEEIGEKAAQADGEACGNCYGAEDDEVRWLVDNLFPWATIISNFQNTT